jgi:predicted transglutaminase-like cysteine proteinase
MRALLLLVLLVLTWAGFWIVTDSKVNANVVVLPPAILEPGPVARPPGGYIQLCNDDPRECERAPAPARVRATQGILEVIREADRRVHQRVVYITDEEQFGTPENWRFPDNGLGDCEDFVLAKKRELMARGIPEGAMQFVYLIIKVAGREEGHLILAIQMESETGHPFEIYLDQNNNHGGTVFTRRTLDPGYRLIKRQSLTDPNIWVLYDATPRT